MRYFFLNNLWFVCRSPLLFFLCEIIILEKQKEENLPSLFMTKDDYKSSIFCFSLNRFHAFFHPVFLLVVWYLNLFISEGGSPKDLEELFSFRVLVYIFYLQVQYTQPIVKCSLLSSQSDWSSYWLDLLSDHLVDKVNLDSVRFSMVDWSSDGSWIPYFLTLR